MRSRLLDLEYFFRINKVGGDGFSLYLQSEKEENGIGGSVLFGKRCALLLLLLLPEWMCCVDV